jgi:hypothetical protein
MGSVGWADGAAGVPGAAGQCKDKKDWRMMDQVGEAQLPGVPMDKPTLRDRQSTLILQPLLDQVHCIIQ